MLSHRARPRQLEALGEGSAVQDDPIFNLQWSFEEWTQRFTGMLHTHIDPIVAPDDGFS